MEKSYKDSGVDIEAGEKTVDNIKELVNSTFNENVITGLGHFGAFYQLNVQHMEEPVLVSSVDGVGTKLKVAIDAKIHNTVGQDLVNHCINDIAVCGAKPLYFLDYMAFGKLDVNVATQIVKGFTKACKNNGVALIGGETAEMPGLYEKNDYDLAGTIVGIVDKKSIIDGQKIAKGNLLIGYKSNGLHTNGYSLARSVLFSKFSLDEYIEIINSDLKTELLKVHKPYFKIVQNLIQNLDVKAFSHITGGGIIGNTKRVLPKNTSIDINWNSWSIPPIFNLIKETGNISDEEMRKVFNLGIGLVAVIDENDFAKAEAISSNLGEEIIKIGKIT